MASPAFRPRGSRRWGSGKPVIALGSDIDDIPQASQKPGVAYHEPIIEGAPGHGEGHNSGMPLQIAAALAVKKVMEQQHLQGTLMLWPGVAEELVGTKAYYVRAGVFKDVDISIFTHVADNLGVSWGDGNQNGLVSVQYNFKGESAHAAAAPWRGTLGARRGRADGRRLELPPRTSAPAAALALRHHQRRRSAERRAAQRVRLVLLPRNRATRKSRSCGRSAIRMAKAATLMTDTEVTSTVLGSAWPGHFNKTDRRNDAGEHREGRPAASGRKPIRSWRTRCSTS